MKKLTLLLFALLAVLSVARPQGCIAIRNLTGFGQFTIPEVNGEPVKWLVNANSRYSQFRKTFDGSNEKPTPVENQPFSQTFILDFSLARIFENGWSVAADIPFMAASRETWQEHNTITKEKRTTSSFGLADIRVAAYKWLLDVSTYHNGNIQAGLGLKLPTGDYRYQDYFHKSTGTVIAPVNNTIQLGDGGLGITAEINAYYTISKVINLYANAFYLFSPRDQNGVSSLTGGKPGVPGHPEISDSVVVAAGGTVNSVADAFTLRGGVNFTLKKLVLWGGVRMEGSPVHDAIGASNGTRRAGYAVSVEPGINYKFNRSAIFAFVPIPVYRTTKQTVPDKIISDATGTHISSPGGMMDYLIFVGMLFRI